MTEYAARIVEGTVVEVVALLAGVPLASAFHPAAGFVTAPAGTSVGQTYADGAFGPPVSSVSLAAAKASKVQALTSMCATAIVSGFSSTALGAAHRYPSQQTDQINLMGSVTASLLPDVGSTWATPFWCADAAGVWDFRMHTAEQIQAAGADGKGYVVACQTLLADLSEQVASATTVAALDDIVWADPA